MTYHPFQGNPQAFPYTDTNALQIIVNENQELREKLANAQKAMDDFKDKVGRKAMNLAREHQWCNDVENALRELDIPIPDMTETVEITIKFELTGIPHADINSIDHASIESSIDFAEINLDEGWEDVEQIDYEVISSRIVPKGETR